MDFFLQGNARKNHNYSCLFSCRVFFSVHPNAFTPEHPSSQISLLVMVRVPLTVRSIFLSALADSFLILLLPTESLTVWQG